MAFFSSTIAGHRSANRNGGQGELRRRPYWDAIAEMCKPLRVLHEAALAVQVGETLAAAEADNRKEEAQAVEAIVVVLQHPAAVLADIIQVQQAKGPRKRPYWTWQNTSTNVYG
jgi:hypothetical protein